MTLRGQVRGLIFLLMISACGSEDTVLLVDVSQGSMAKPPESISIAAYTADDPRVLVGSVAGIAWSDALEGLGLKMKDSAAGRLSIEAVGVPSGIADPVSTTVKAKQSNGPITLVFREGTVTIPDAGAAEDAAGDRAEVALPDAPADTTLDIALPGADADAPTDTALDVALPGSDAGIETADATSDTATDETGSGFTPPQSIEPTAVINDVAVAVDPLREHVYVAWTETTKIRVKRWSRTSGTWGETQDLKVEEGKPAYPGLQIGVDPTGRVYVAWIINPYESPASVAGIWTSQASPGEVLSLSPPQRVVAGPCTELGMAVAGTGLVYLVHTIKPRESPFYTGVYTAVYEGSTWKTNPEPLLTPYSQDSANLSVVASGIGTAMTAFDWIGNGRVRTVTYHLSGTTRTDTGFLDLEASEPVESRSLAMNRLGEAAVSWTRGNLDLYVAKYSAAAGWSTPVFLVAGDVQNAHALAMADDGTLTVAYAKRMENKTYNLAVQTGKIPGTFTQPKFLESDNAALGYDDAYEYASEPQLAVDTSGNVLLVFHKKISDTTGSLWGSRLESGSWREPTQLARIDGLRLLGQRLAVSNGGFGAYAFTYQTDRAAPNPSSQKAFVGFFQ